MKIKEMKYKENRELELLYNNRYKNYNFYILSLGTHPTAYVEIPENNSLFKKDYNDIDISVHGGLTYSRDYLCIEKDVKINGWFIGWDYAHFDDYVGFLDKYGTMFNNLGIYGDDNGKKHTTKEIIEDCISVIEQIIEMEKKDGI